MQGEPQPECVASLFRAHGRDVYRYLLRLTRDPAVAEELTQQVFADAMSVSTRFRPGTTSPLALLYTIARRRFVDLSRRTARRPIAPLAAVDIATADPDPMAAAALRDALVGLPPSLRSVGWLRLVCGWTTDEIAQSLGIEKEACRKRLLQAKRFIRTELERRGFDPGTPSE